MLGGFPLAGAYFGDGPDDVTSPVQPPPVTEGIFVRNLHGFSSNVAVRSRSSSAGIHGSRGSVTSVRKVEPPE